MFMFVFTYRVRVHVDVNVNDDVLKSMSVKVSVLTLLQEPELLLVPVCVAHHQLFIQAKLISPWRCSAHAEHGGCDGAAPPEPADVPSGAPAEEATT